MPNFLHRTTKSYQASIPYSDLQEPLANYIEEPDLSAVTGFNNQYWTITGDVITLMSQAERDAVDAAALVTQLDSISDELDRVQTILRAFAEVVLDEFNVLRAEQKPKLPNLTLAQLKTAVRNKLGS